MDESLIKLAETLDDARKQANAIDAAAPQVGVYGKIHVALVDTLTLITAGDYSKAKDVYYSIMEDGNSVREALATVLKPDMFDVTSVRVSDQVWERNESLPSIGDDLRCIICNRPVNPEGKNVFWVHMSERWNAYPNGTEEDVILATEGDMGGHPVGPECAKKIPANYKEKTV